MDELTVSWMSWRPEGKLNLIAACSFMMKMENGFLFEHDEFYFYFLEYWNKQWKGEITWFREETRRLQANKEDHLWWDHLPWYQLKVIGHVLSAPDVPLASVHGRSLFQTAPTLKKSHCISINLVGHCFIKKISGTAHVFGHITKPQMCFFCGPNGILFHNAQPCYFILHRMFSTPQTFLCLIKKTSLKKTIQNILVPAPLGYNHCEYLRI